MLLLKIAFIRCEFTAFAIFGYECCSKNSGMGWFIVPYLKAALGNIASRKKTRYKRDVLILIIKFIIINNVFLSFVEW